MNIICGLDPFLKERFAGFSAPDTGIPRIKKFPALFILNTDVSSGPGRHWCTATFFKNRVCEFFDPLGNPPEFYNFRENLLQKCDDIIHNGRVLQALHSSTCGHHCLMYNYYRARNMNSEQIIDKYYSASPRLNDHIVFLFVFNHFGPSFAYVDGVDEYRGY